MALPAEPAAEGQRTVPTPFLMKTYQLVDDHSLDDVISWNGGGSGFVVWRPGDFARDLLPRRFKHSNFSSFVRQLNTYGFRKISTDRWEFAHEYFLRDEELLLSRIERRKVSHSPATAPMAVDEQIRSSGSPKTAEAHPAAPSSSCSMAVLMEENEQLRTENKRLSSENAQMKSLCDNIRLLMIKNYGSSRGGDDEGQGTVEEGSSPRLFGVQIGSKRPREDDEMQLNQSGSEDSSFDPPEEEELRLRLSLCDGHDH